MGLESHITRELQREKSGFVEGEHYWFEFGLTCENEDVATAIVDILNESGEFGEATIRREDAAPYIKSRPFDWKIDFGIHPQFARKVI